VNERVRDIIERQQRVTQAQPQDDRAQRLAENAKRHIAEQSDLESWLNEKKIRQYLELQMDANPVEVEDTLNVLRTATIFTREDLENGSAINTALAMARGEL
jgi:hypothetical protein